MDYESSKSLNERSLSKIQGMFGLIYHKFEDLLIEYVQHYFLTQFHRDIPEKTKLLSYHFNRVLDLRKSRNQMAEIHQELLIKILVILNQDVR